MLGTAALAGLAIQKARRADGADRGKADTLVRGVARNWRRQRYWRFLIGGTVSAAQRWEQEDLAQLLSQSGLRSIPVMEIAPGYPDMLLHVPLLHVPLLHVPTPRGDWDTPYNDLVALAALVRHFGPRRLFEVGTFKGIGTLTLIANAPEDAHLTTLDILDHDQRIAFAETPYGPRVTALIADSTDFDTDAYARSVDFIFVDADHRYGPVKNDSAKAFEMLAPGGVIVWHDYPFFSGVKKALDEIAQTKEIVHLEGTRLALYRDTTRPC